MKGYRTAFSGALVALVLLLAVTSTTASFTAQTGNTGNTLTAASLDSWTPLSASATRTGPTTCLVTWTARASPPATLTYDVTDGAGSTLATAVSGTSISVTVPTSTVTPTVKARATGWVSASATTSSTACAGVPSAPTGLAAPAADTQSVLTWTTPADNGGSAITGYTATAVPSDGSLPTRTCTATPPATTCTVTALTNGVTYTVTVAAANAQGSGPSSSSVTTLPYPASVMSASALRLWLDGADAATLFQNTTATTPATTAGQAVARWNDKSGRTDGSGINYAQSTVSTERPALSLVNGHLVPLFDGTSDYLGLRSVSMLPVGTTTSTIIAVATMTGSVGSDYQTLFEYGTASTGASRTIYKNSGNANDIVDAYVTGLVTDGTWSASPTISTAEFASANVKMWHAGRPQQSAAGAFNTGTAFADIGRETTNGYYWKGAVPELIVVNTVLTTAQRRSVEEYLSRKWGSLITPGAPTAVTATAASTSAAVSWTAPTYDGGTAITGYTVTASPGPRTCTAVPPATTCTVTSLTNGTAYTFAVTATNAVGIGPSATSASVTPLAPAGAPTSVAATNADTTSSVSWTAPASNGGAAITAYTATAVPSDGSANITCTSAASPCSLTGLTNGLTYSITVAATTAYGTGTASSAVTASPYPSTVMTSAALQLWLDGADSATLLASSACTGAVATTTVGCWKDKSTSLNHAKQATGSLAPTLTTVAGRSVPGFDGTDDTMSLTPASLPNGTNTSTSFVVGRLTDPSPVTSGYRIGLLWGQPAVGKLRSVFKGSGSATAFVDTFGSGSASPGSWTSGADVLVAQFSAATVTAWLNSGVAGGPTSQAFTTGTTHALLGNGASGSQGWLGQLPEIIVLNTAPSAAQRRSIEEYLARKWSGTITPQAPTGVSGSAGTGQVTVSWTAPAWNGGSAVTSSTVTANPGGATCTASAPATSCTVTGLTGGTAYTFTVTATNAVGTGPASAASGSVTALGTPGAPTGVAASVGDTTSSVSWTAPASTGGSAITGYTATAVPGTGGLPNVTCSAASSPCSLTGLVDGVSYTVSVTATNAIGTGAASSTATVIPLPAVMSGSGLKVWLDAQNAASLNSSTGCAGSTVSAGSAVSCWKDRSASGWNAVRGTTSPVLTASAINGRQALRFVKTNPDYFSITSAGIGAVGSANRSLFAVTVARTSYGLNGTNNAGIVAGWGGWNGGLLAKAYGGTTTIDTFQSDGYASSGPTLMPASTAGSTSPTIASTIYSSSGGTLSTGLALDGEGSLTSSSLAGTWYTHPDLFRVGSSGTVASDAYAYPLDGDVGEVLVFNSALSAAQRRVVEEYLARRWGQTIAPAAPATAVATAGTSTATVTFTAPVWNGGAAVTAYTVAPTSGAGSCTWTSGLTASCTGLTHGASYTFTVAATNSVGTGPSTTTAAVTP